MVTAYTIPLYTLHALRERLKRNRANLARRNRHISLSLPTPVFSCTHHLHLHHFPLSLTALILASSLPCCPYCRLEQLENGHFASRLGGFAGNDGPWQTFPHQELCPQALSQPRSKNKYCAYMIRETYVCMYAYATYTLYMHVHIRTCTISHSLGTEMFPLGPRVLLGLIELLLSQTESDTCTHTQLL